MKCSTAIAVFFMATGLIGGIWAQDDTSIYHGPYILNVTRTGISVFWETREPAMGFVEYGTIEDYGAKTEDTAQITHEYPIAYPDEDDVAAIELPPDSLISGENLLAVGVWNSGRTSDMTLIVRLDLDDTIALDEGSPVKYIVPHSDIPDWMGASFDDSAWMDGISGVGQDDDDDNTEIEVSSSAYVRYRFNVDDASTIENIYLFVDYDDGYIAWLNGTEIRRSGNISDSIPSWDSLASSSHSSTGLEKGTPNEKRWRAKDAPEFVGTAYIHRVALSDLTPGTKYHYRVHSDQDVSADGRFRTAPDDLEASFRFAVIGDGRSRPDGFKSVADSILKDDPDFLIYVGDLIRSGTNYSNWHDQYFTPGADLIRNIPIFPVIGNHERGGSANSWYYRYITQDNWYSFDYGNVHFVVLDSQRQGSRAQEDWLIADLEANKDAKWLFIAIHSHVYSSKGRGVSMRIHEKWTPIFEKYGAQVVFSGHEHHYERSYRRGIYYIITGGGGVSLGTGEPLSRSYNPYKQIAYSINEHCTVEIYDDHAVLWITMPDGRVFDAVTIWADRSQDVRPPSRVKNLQAVPGIWSVSLAWNAALDEDLIGYNVYRSDDDGNVFQKLTSLPIKETSYLDKNLMGDSYTYKVVATDDWDNESAASEVTQVTPQKPGTTYLSDLEVVSSDGEYSLDLDCSGNSIQLGDQVHNRGIGVRGETALVYNLAKQFKGFRANVGIDGSLGSDDSDVIFKVFVDGKLIYESDVIKWDSEIQQLSISVENAVELKLVTGNNGSSKNDDAAWADARLIR